MVAIFTGAGTGHERGSGSVLGAAGLLGQAATGRSGEQVMLNAATGNLVIAQRDEFLLGRGPDAAIARTYNSRGDLTDDNGDNWRQSTDRRVYGLVGAANTFGSTVRRVAADGSVATYRYDGAGYVETDGAGSYDRLSYAGGVWTWTDGDTRTAETYGHSAGGYAYVTEQRDTSGNALTFSYAGDRLTEVATANGERISYVWSGSAIAEIQTHTSESGTARMQTRTRYQYDAAGRLSSVTVDLSPEDNSVADAKSYVTSYGFHGTSRLVAWIAQTDGTRIDVAYDASNRVTSIAQTVNGAAARTTTLGYGADFTTVTDPAGQVTRLDYAAGDTAVPVETWGTGNLTREAATIDGAPATRFTVQTAGAWAGAYQPVRFAAGDYVRLQVSLQAVGAVTSQALGLHADDDAWGPPGGSFARIVSGPGRVEQVSGGLWRVVDLSTTEATRVEIVRRFDQGSTGGAYLYGDLEGGHRAGTSFIAGEVSILRSSTATTADRGDLTTWGTTNLDRTADTSIAGAPAYKFAVKVRGDTAPVSKTFTAKANETYSFVVTLKASGSFHAHRIGLDGAKSGWGAASLTSAQILSGPGSLSRQSGALYAVAGLSATEPTRILVTRTFDRDETAYARLYVALGDNEPVGASVVVASANLLGEIAETASANLLTKITAPPAASGAAQQVTQFAYNARGDLAAVTDPAGKTTSFTHNATGDVLTVTDRLGAVTARTYDAPGRLRREERQGIAADAQVALGTAYAYDAASRLRYSVSPEGRVTRITYGATGDAVRSDVFTGALYTAGGTPTEAQLDAWVAGLADKSAREITLNDYDARGALRRTTSYAAADANGEPVTGAGSQRIDYVYDQTGQLLHRTTSSLNAEHFLYDGLGRLTASTDAAGATTSIAFADAAQQTVVTLASGLVRTSSYNRAGDLVGMSEAGGYATTGATAYQYDPLGRVRVASDATGRKRYVVYDAVGRKVADVGELGDLTEYRYDSRDRLAHTVVYRTAIGAAKLALVADPATNPDIAAIRPGTDVDDLRDWTVYDDEGRVLQRFDGTGSTIVNGYDAAGRLIRTTRYANKLANISWTTLPTGVRLPTADAARDVVERLFYDRDGNRIGTLDGEGYLTRIRYDAAGREIETVAFATPVPAASRASATFTQLLAAVPAAAGDRTTRTVRDGQGRERYAIDALNNVVEFVYAGTAPDDATGVVRQRIAHAVPISTLGSYTVATVRAALDAAGAYASPDKRQSFAVYDARGDLAYDIAADGAVTGYGYDASGNVTKTVRYRSVLAIGDLPSHAAMAAWAAGNAGDAGNRITRHYYSARDGELRMTVDALGYVTRFDYDAEGRLGETLRFDAAMGDVGDGTTIADVAAFANTASASSVATTNSYDARGRLVDTVDGNGIVTRRTYALTGTLSSITVAEGSTDKVRTSFGYDAAGRTITRVADADGFKQTTRYTYDGLGNLLTQVAPDTTSVTTYAYDRAGRMVARTDALGGVARYDYNAFGEQVRALDERGGATYTYFDANGRAAIVRDAEDYVTETAYSAFGEVASLTRRYNRAGNAAAIGTPPSVAADARDATTTYGYDKLGRLVRTVDAEGFAETSRFDGLGDRVEARNKFGGLTTSAYDRRGQLVAETIERAVSDNAGNVLALAGPTTTHAYDARGNRIQTIEGASLPGQRTTSYRYDKGDRLIEKKGTLVVVGLPGATGTVQPVESYAYDLRGNRTQVTDAGGRRTVTYYDRLDRTFGEVDATGAYTTYTYTANNVVASRRSYAARLNPANVSRTTRPTPTANAALDREVSFASDALGRTRQTSVANVRAGQWNGSAFVVATQAATAGVAYDAASNVVSTTDENGAAAFTYYDRLGRKVAEVDREGYLTEWTRDTNGNVTAERRYAQRVTGATIAARPTGVVHGDDRVTTFTYDRNGRRTSETRVGVEAWAVNRNTGLMQAATADATVRYTYNALGLVASKQEATGDTVFFVYDAAGRMVEERRGSADDDEEATLRYSYDGLDNIVRVVESNRRVTRNSFDASGLLVQSEDAAGSIRSFHYDAAGRKLGQSYTRLNSAGTLAHEGIAYRYDNVGRLVYQSMATWSANSWDNRGDATEIAYNAFGEVATRSLNGQVQERSDYDAAGRMWRSTSGDGVTRHFVHDAAGRQTLSLGTDGTTNVQGKSLDEVLAVTTGNGAYTVGAVATGIVVTASTYDARGLVTGTRLFRRQIDGTGNIYDLITARSYTAFGELASETDARGATTSYAYNRMGRTVAITRPQVSVTGEDGQATTIAPVERHYFDISGRLVGLRDANQALTTRSLVRNTGYDGKEALIGNEWRADGGFIVNVHDIFGDLVMRGDELFRAYKMTYDGMGRLLTTSDANSTGIEHSYAYDALGQRIRHTQAGRAAGDAETTDYDIQGRVVALRSFGGDTTAIAYAWENAITAGTGVSGGWRETTTYVNGRTQVKVADTYGRTTSRTDMGGAVTTTTYDHAGRVATITGIELQRFTWYNSGLLARQSSDLGTRGSERAIATFGYDAGGNRIVETLARDGEQWRNSTAAYDALGRMTNWAEAGSVQAPAASTSWSYDAVGNIRRALTTRPNIDGYGQGNGSYVEDRWQTFDSLGRVVIADGRLEGGRIVRGNGTSYTYDAAGQRATATRTV